MARQKRHKCPTCSRWFKTEASRDDHIMQTHTLADIPGVGQEGARAVLDAYDDLPDGAYFAVAEELGVDWGER